MYVTSSHGIYQVAISRCNDIVVPILCYDIVVVRSPRRYRRSRSYDSDPSVVAGRIMVNDGSKDAYTAHLITVIFKLPKFNISSFVSKSKGPRKTNGHAVIQVRCATMPATFKYALY